LITFTVANDSDRKMVAMTEWILQLAVPINLGKGRKKIEKRKLLNSTKDPLAAVRNGSELVDLL